MSYSEVLAAIHERFATVDEIVYLAVGEPTSLQGATPAIYSMLTYFERHEEGNTVRVLYRTRHRLCVKWQDRQVAEEVINELVNKLPAALCAAPMQGRLFPAGEVSITRGDAGVVDFAGVDYRCVDLFSEATEIGPLGGNI